MVDERVLPLQDRRREIRHGIGVVERFLHELILGKIQRLAELDQVVDDLIDLERVEAAHVAGIAQWQTAHDLHRVGRQELGVPSPPAEAHEILRDQLSRMALGAIILFIVAPHLAVARKSMAAAWASSAAAQVILSSAPVFSLKRRMFGWIWMVVRPQGHGFQSTVTSSPVAMPPQ